MPAFVRDLSPLWAGVMLVALVVMASAPERAYDVLVSVLTAIVYSAIGWWIR